MTAISAAQLLIAAPHAHPDIIAAIGAGWPDTSAKYGLTNRNRALGFLSTAYEESGGFTVLSENLNYSAERAHEVFPGIFRSVAAAEPYAFNPQAFANIVYNGRMGNRLGSNDGWLYRGQGLPQITGHDNFAYLAKLTGLPLLDQPQLVTAPEHMLECAVALFVAYPGILTWCDDANWRAVWALVGSGRATGPVINFANHEAALEALERAIATDGPGLASAPMGALAIQTALNKAGASPPLILDGLFGEDTKAAVRAFQAARGLYQDGIAGPETIAALSAVA